MADTYDTYEMIEARSLLAEGQYTEALLELDKTPVAERSAEWHFLRSQIEEQACRYYEALQSRKRAVELDPSNQAYKAALKDMQKTFGQNASGKSEEEKKGKCGRPGCCSSETGWECCGELCCGACCEGICESCDCS